MGNGHGGGNADSLGKEKVDPAARLVLLIFLSVDAMICGRQECLFARP